MKIGRFSDAASTATSSSCCSSQNCENDENIRLASAMKPGDRCQVEAEPNSSDTLKKRGTVRFVGFTKFKPGMWVGVEYDEPLGKHDGTVEGEKYFSCRAKHGAFLRPNKVTVGDFPEEDLFDDLDDELDEM
jgi:tubulin-folding cofactor B